jgi:hypothetical protein
VCVRVRRAIKPRVGGRVRCAVEGRRITAVSFNAGKPANDESRMKEPSVSTPQCPARIRAD